MIASQLSQQHGCMRRWLLGGNAPDMGARGDRSHPRRRISVVGAFSSTQIGYPKSVN